MKSDRYFSNVFLKIYIFLLKHPILRNMKILAYYIDFMILLFIRKPKKLQTAKKQIVIVYNLNLGDCIVWLCSIRRIREIYPENEYEMTLICQKGIHYIFEKEEIFNHVIPLNFTEATFRMKKRREIMKILRSKYYDILLDPIGVAECTTNVLMSRAIVAEKKITICDMTIKRHAAPKWLINSIYSEYIKVTKPELSLMEFYSEFIKGLGMTDFKFAFQKPISTPSSLELPNRYFIIFPSASQYLKCWPIDRYGEIARRIHEKTGLMLLLCGTDKDREIVDKFRSILGDLPYIDIVGKTSVLEFVSIIQNASLIVTNDTSTYHIAAVSEVSVAIITGGYTYKRYVSYEFEDKEAFKRPCIIVHEMPCFNCENRCPYVTNKSKYWPCLEKISTSYAWEKIEALINANHIGR